MTMSDARKTKNFIWTQYFQFASPKSNKKKFMVLPPNHQKKCLLLLQECLLANYLSKKGMPFGELVKDRTMKRKNIGHTTLLLPLSLPNGESLGSS